MHVDEDKTPGAFWLTGSQAFRLMQRVQESLAGRVCLLTMAPLSQAEANGYPIQPFELELGKLQDRAGYEKAIDTPTLF